MAHYNAVSRDEKLRIVDAYLQGEKTAVIALLFGLQGTGTVSNIAREFGAAPREWPKRIPDETVSAIRQAFAVGGITQSELARQFGVGYGTVQRIVSGGRKQNAETVHQSYHQGQANPAP